MTTAGNRQVTNWQEWHQAYADPRSSLSRRLQVVRGYLARALADTPTPTRLISLCAGDGRDSIPVIAESGREVQALLVELDPGLAQGARRTAADLGIPVTVRTDDASMPSSFDDHAPATIMMLCGIFGNISDADIENTVNAIRGYLTKDAIVIWTRGDHDVEKSDEPPSERVRGFFARAGFEEVDFTGPDDADFRVGVHRWPHPTGQRAPEGQRLFTFRR